MGVVYLEANGVIAAIFPDGRWLSRGWRNVIVIGCIGIVIAVAGNVLTPDLLIFTEFESPVGLRGVDVDTYVRVVSGFTWVRARRDPRRDMRSQRIALRVLRWGFANHGGEIAGEMRLIGVAEFGGKTGPVDGRAGRHPFGCLVQPVPPDHPLGSYADVLGKEPLQAPHANVNAIREPVDSGDGRLGCHPLHNSGHGLSRRILCGKFRAEKALRDRGHLGLVIGAGHSPFWHSGAEHLAGGQGAIGDRRHGRAQERSEATRAEGHSEHPSLVAEDSNHVAARHPTHASNAVQERKVHVRVRHDQLPVRWLAAQVPGDGPVVGDERGKVRTRLHEPVLLEPRPAAAQSSVVPLSGSARHIRRIPSRLFNTQPYALPSIEPIRTRTEEWLMQPHSLVAVAAAPTIEIFRGIAPDQLDAPTPCSEYDVRGLINHLLFWGPSLEGAARKELVPPPAEGEQ